MGNHPRLRLRDHPLLRLRHHPRLRLRILRPSLRPSLRRHFPLPSLPLVRLSPPKLGHLVAAAVPEAAVCSFGSLWPWLLSFSLLPLWLSSRVAVAVTRAPVAAQRGLAT